MPVYNDPVLINCKINNVHVPFEIDSGAAVSTITDQIASLLNVEIKQTNRIIKAYGNNAVEILGEVMLPITYKNVMVSHVFYVVSNASVNLFGMDLFRAFNFYIVHNPAVLSANKLTSDILHDVSDYFSDDFIANVNEYVKLEVPADTCPVY